jgi:hypothetical protein
MATSWVGFGFFAKSIGEEQVWLFDRQQEWQLLLQTPLLFPPLDPSHLPRGHLLPKWRPVAARTAVHGACAVAQRTDTAYTSLQIKTKKTFFVIADTYKIEPMAFYIYYFLTE